MSAAGPSTTRPKVNLRSTAVKRIMQEASELANAEEDDFVAAPLETDIFEWHCTMRGVPGSEYEGGLYHLRILLPPNYPMAAPDIMLLTPNGRFELGTKICIDGLTSFHAGSWQPAWGVRTALTGLRSFWMQGGEALSAIGALDYPKEERKRLAKLSQSWRCPTCGMANHEHFTTTAFTQDESPGQSAEPDTREEAGTAVVETDSGNRSPQPEAAEEEPDLQQSSAPPAPVPNNPPQPVRSRRPVPIWIDLPIGILVALLAVLWLRRVM